jgi:hypothetical protein
MIFGAGAASALTNSTLVCTTCTLASGAAEPPVVPVPSAAQPSFAGSTARPNAGLAAADGGATTSAAATATMETRDKRFMAGTSPQPPLRCLYFAWASVNLAANWFRKSCADS